MFKWSRNDLLKFLGILSIDFSFFVTASADTCFDGQHVHFVDAQFTVSHSAEILENVRLIHKPVSLQPRGLINKGNWCYINAVSLTLEKINALKLKFVCYICQKFFWIILVSIL